MYLQDKIFLLVHKKVFKVLQFKSDN